MTKAVLAMHRARYCKGSDSDCARYMVFAALGEESVPSDLHPNDKLKALGILKQYRRPAAAGL